jgi:hypothetical protein
LADGTPRDGEALLSVIATGYLQNTGLKAIVNIMGSSGVAASRKLKLTKRIPLRIMLKKYHFIFI